MHSYASSLTNRTQVVYSIALISVALFLAIGILVDHAGIGIPFYIGTPSSGLFFFLFFAAYDRYLWRARLAGLRFSRLVDLNGTYSGYVIIKAGLRPEEAQEIPMPCLVRITQTWSKISVAFETPFSRSQSSMASLDEADSLHPQLSGLRYYFLVEPKQENAVAGMNAHAGLARLHPETRDWSVLSGDFFADFGYHRFGAYHLERLPDDLDAHTWLAGLPAAGDVPGTELAAGPGT